ncbi:hypothetical protein HanRHA438_Chr13g0627731 [Helianthus annuus]|nr:hypothetical protein HanRHA438_Chr13g0627731 [Helianthus annuus]
MVLLLRHISPSSIAFTLILVQLLIVVCSLIQPTLAPAVGPPAALRATVPATSACSYTHM